MKKIYIYPISSRAENIGFNNPYIDDLIKSLGHYYEIINKDKPSRYGIFDFLKYIGKTNYFFFNWIEKLPENKGGTVQVIFLLLLFPIIKLFNIKVVWTMHNKLAHSTEHIFLKKVIFKTMLRKANFIFTHSNEGSSYGTSINHRSGEKIHYLPHPVKDRRIKVKEPLMNDILIWGTISPFKGIDKFLEYLKSKNLLLKYKILIIGKSVSKEYYDSLLKYSNEKIKIKNEFITDDELQKLIKQSKLILFTYSKSSVLSSGVLMDSLGYGANILGPDVGAFSDLAKDGIIKVFSDYEDLVLKINEALSDMEVFDNKEKTEHFIADNSWDRYAEKIYGLI